MKSLTPAEKILYLLPAQLQAEGITEESVVHDAIEQILNLANECPDEAVLQQAIDDLIEEKRQEKQQWHEKAKLAHRLIHEHYQLIGWNNKISIKKAKNLLPKEGTHSPEEAAKIAYDRHFEPKKTDCLMGYLRYWTKRHYPYLEAVQIREKIDPLLDLSLPYSQLLESLDAIFAPLQEELRELQEETKERYLETLRLKHEIACVDEIELFFDAARQMRRHFICLIGPTNSGKTHAAVKALKAAGSGLFLAPLRLLAREIYDDLIQSGHRANLLTGEEEIRDEEARISSCTIEKADIDRPYEVAIIDEAQFLGSQDRGSAWTRALLGVQADTIYVVGSPACLDVVRKIADTTHDTLEIHQFERLAELRCIPDAVGFETLRAGDCLVVFSKREVYRLKYLLQDAGFSPSIIYGDLPPEVKIRQSELFNTGQNDILVATDAIGYGLNLKIKRLLFSSMQKFNGIDTVTLELEEFKQIAGRAGRYGKENLGWFGFFDGINPYAEKDYRRFLKLSKKITHIHPVTYAHFFPEYEHIRDFSEVTGSAVLTELISEYRRCFSEDSQQIYRLQNIESYYHNATIIEKFAPNLDLRRKYYLAFAPTKIYHRGHKDVTEVYFREMIRAIAKETDFPFIRPIVDTDEIFECENVCRKASLYRWMSNRCEELPSYALATETYEEHKNRLIALLESESKQRAKKQTRKTRQIRHQRHSSKHARKR